MKISYEKKMWLTAYLFLLPAVGALIAFYIIPFIMGFNTSMYIGRGWGEKFAWFSNYFKLMSEPEFWNSLKVTFIFTAAYTAVSATIGLLLAVLLNSQGLKFTSFFKAAIFMPYIIALVVIGLVWYYMLDDVFGIINYFLTFVGLKRVLWLKSSHLALISLIIVQIWYTAGFNMVLFLAGLQALPRSYYEAAEIDGAGSLHQLLYITIPLLVPTFVFVILISILNGFVNVFTLAKIITRGGPVDATNVLILYTYDLAFQRLNLPLANAVTYIIFVILAVVSLIQYRLQERTIYGLK